MSDDDVISVRLEALEEFRRDQQVINKSIADSLHRIELTLNQTVAKACPLPGHCVVLEREQKGKWDQDKLRFERMERRLSENDDWHKMIESRMDAKLDDLTDKIAAIQKTVWGAAGGCAVLAVFAPIILPVLQHWITLHR